MMTVHKISNLTGVSIRALHHYDKIGLLHPAEVTDAGYRLYDDAQLERLQCILLFKELQFPLKDIRDILDSPGFDREKALEQQITLLEMKMEHLENLIRLARTIKTTGVNHMNFTAFDTEKMDAYAKQAKESWGHTKEYQEYEQKSEGRTVQEGQQIARGLLEVFAQFGAIKEDDPWKGPAQEMVKKLQDYISNYYYTCSKEILASLGEMYASEGSMSENIDEAGGDGTAVFAAKAIQIYCSR